MSGTMRVSLEITASGQQAVTQINGVAQALRDTGNAASEASQSTAAAATAINQVGQASGQLGSVAPRVAAGLRETATAANVAGREVRITGEHMRQLAPQINDIATQLALGQNPFMILAAQGGQITQIFGGVRQTLGALVSFLGPAGIAGILGVSAAGFLATALERDARALNDLSQRLRATRGDAAALAREVDQASENLSQSSGLSRGDAREAARIIAGQRDFRGGREEIERLVSLSADLARVMGTDVPTAAERFVSRAIRDPASAAREAAAGGLLGFNDAMRRQIELLQAGGDRAGATARVLAQFGQASAGAARDLTPLQEAWQNVTNSMERAARAATDLANRIIGGVSGLPRDGGVARGDGARPASAIPEGDWTFAGRLSQRESGNRTGIMNDYGYAGLYQFGSGRLAELGLYQPSDGEVLSSRDRNNPLNWIGRFTIPGFENVRNIADFRGNERAQDAAFAVHLARIDAAIQRLIQERPETAQLSRDGLRAVAHLGGEGGMRQFVLSGGTSNPGDGNRTRLSDYYRQFGGPGAILPGETPATAPSVPRAQSDLEEANRRIAARGPLRSDRAATLAADIAFQEANLATALGVEGPGGENVARLREDLVRLRAELQQLDDPITRANRALGDQFEVSREAAGATRELTQAQLEARNRAREAGQSPEQTEILVGLARRSTEARQDAAFNDNVAARERELAGHRERFSLIQQGATAVERARIVEEARTLALATAEEGTDRYNRQVERYIQLLTQAGSVPRLTSVFTEQAREREDLQVANGLLGASAGDRAARLARLRTSRQLGASAETPEGQQAIAEAEGLARNRVELERNQAAYQEIGRIGEQAFDRIGQAVTSGTLTLKSFGDIGKSVISELMQAFLRLAIINPIKNSLFGDNKPPLGEVFGAGIKLLGGFFGGGDPSLGSNIAAKGTPITTYGVGDAPIGSLYHKGGIVGLEPTAIRAVNDNLFRHAPRFHQGGHIGADEVPAILQRGEGVFTPEQMARLGPAGGQAVTINMPIQFSGDSGSEADRAGLLALVDARVRAGVASMMPEIARGSHQYTLSEVSRGGSAARALGRR